MIQVKGGLSDLVKDLEEVQKQFEYGEFLQRLAFLLNSSIQRRVQDKGVGSDGRKLSPYSKQYANYKKSTGRQTKYRDLTYTGNMWQSLTATKLGSDAARMFFGSAAEAKKAGYNDKRTPFFELGDAEKRIIDSEIKKLLSKL